MKIRRWRREFRGRQRSRMQLATRWMDGGGSFSRWSAEFHNRALELFNGSTVEHRVVKR